MNIFPLTSIFVGILSLSFGIFVFLQGRKEKLNRSWFLFTLSIGIWSIGLGMTMIVNEKSSALFWQKVLYIGTIFIPVLFFYFCIIFTQTEKKLKQFFRLNLFIGCLFLFSLFVNNWFIGEIKERTYFGYWPVETGWLYYPFLIWFGGMVIYSFLILGHHLRKKEIDIIRRKQGSTIFYGTLIGFLAGSLNFLLDFGITFPPIHNFFVVSYIIFTALAITRYHLFGIEVILTETLVGLIWILLLVQIFIAPTIFWKIVNGITLILFSIFGYLLLRGVFKEIERRTEIERISQAKSEFIAIASHQLRTPLTAIKGYLSMIIEGDYGKLPERVKEKMESVYQSNERLIKLVNDILCVSKIEAGEIEMEFERTDLKKLIKEVIDELSIKAKEKGLYLNFEEPKESFETLLDREKFRQVILNLIDNAIKYTQEGGITVKLQALKNKFQIVISDTGEGLTEEEKRKIFERFSRGTAGTKFWVGGAGLGLYIAKEFVQMHKGKIWAESEGRGKGSTFYIELPIIQEKKSIDKNFQKQ